MARGACQVCVARATGFAALHHPLQHRPFAEALQLIEAPFEFLETLRATFQLGSLLRAPGCLWEYGGVAFFLRQ